MLDKCFKATTVENTPITNICSRSYAFDIILETGKLITQRRICLAGKQTAKEERNKINIVALNPVKSNRYWAEPVMSPLF